MFCTVVFTAAKVVDLIFALVFVRSVKILRDNYLCLVHVPPRA